MMNNIIIDNLDSVLAPSSTCIISAGGVGHVDGPGLVVMIGVVAGSVGSGVETS